MKDKTPKRFHFGNFSPNFAPYWPHFLIGGALGTPKNKQNRDNKEQNWGKRTKMGPFWGVVFHENTSRKSKFRSKGAEFFGAPPILQLNCAYENNPLFSSFLFSDFLVLMFFGATFQFPKILSHLWIGVEMYMGTIMAATLLAKGKKQMKVFFRPLLH